MSLPCVGISAVQHVSTSFLDDYAVLQIVRCILLILCSIRSVPALVSHRISANLSAGQQPAVVVGGIAHNPR